MVTIAFICDFANGPIIVILKFRLGEHMGVPHPCRAHASSSCARACALVCGCVAVAAQVAVPIAFICDVANGLETFIFSHDFGNTQGFYISATRMPQTVARVGGRRCSRIKTVPRVAINLARAASPE